MTAHKLLTEIYKSQEVKDCVKKIRPIDQQQDILQHSFLELLEKDEDFIIDLHQRCKLKAYIVKVIYNTSVFTHSKFSKQKMKEVYCEPAKYNFLIDTFLKDDAHEVKEQQEKAADLKCAVSKLYWYKVELLQLYATLGTHKAVADLTGIPRSSIAKTLKLARKEVKQLL